MRSFDKEKQKWYISFLTLCSNDPIYVSILDKIMQIQDQKFIDILMYVQYMTQHHILYRYMMIPSNLTQDLFDDLK